MAPGPIKPRSALTPRPHEVGGKAPVRAEGTLPELPPVLPLPVPQGRGGPIGWLADAGRSLQRLPGVMFGAPPPPEARNRSQIYRRLENIANHVLRLYEREKGSRDPGDPMLPFMKGLGNAADDLVIEIMQKGDWLPSEEDVARIENDYRLVMRDRIEQKLLPTYETLRTLAEESGDRELSDDVVDWKVRYEASIASASPLDDLAREYSDLFKSVLKRQVDRTGLVPHHMDELYLEIVASKLVELDLTKEGLSAQALRDFSAEWTAFRRDYEQDLEKGFDLVDPMMTSHHMLGRGTTADGFLRQLTWNMRGYRAVFGDKAGLVFARSSRLVSEIKDPSGKGTGFFVVLERGWHEAHSGLQMALYEGNPKGMGVSAVLGKVAFQFGEEGVLKIVNIQGAPVTGVKEDLETIAKGAGANFDPEGEVRKRLAKSRGNRIVLQAVVEGAIARIKSQRLPFDYHHFTETLRASLDDALQGQRKRLGQALGKAHPFSALLAGAVHWAHRMGFTRIEGIRDAAQVANQDRLNLGHLAPESAAAIYDASFARFGFHPPVETGDYWHLDLTALSVHNPGGDRAVASLADYVALVLPRNIANNQIHYDSWAKGNPKPAGSEVKAFNAGLADGLNQLSEVRED